MNVDQMGIPIAGIFGAMIGSFLNVLILRLPRDESVVFPGSHCPRCQTPIAWHDNVPVISWLLLGGKCRHCRERISIQYPIIELTTAALWAGAVWHYGANLTGLTAAAFGTLLLGIAVTDARHYLIPDEYTLGGLVLGLLLALRGGWSGLLQAVIGAVTGFVILYVVAVAGEKVFRKEAMGGGDIKMMAMVGAFVGWRGVLLTIFGGSLLGTIVFVPLSLKQKRLVPFGIFLAAAAALTFVFGDTVLRWYIDWVLGG
ncbi:MAG: prepilin peptidase [Gemmatimonadota bacterium]|nr:MAG: prepilin peptidase [Gemmatimonadota bacterium]